MIKIDITLNIGGQDIKIGYDEGRTLYDELNVLYGTPSQQAVYDDVFPEDTVTATAGNCGMDMGDYPNEGKETNADCTSPITVSTADYVKDTDHLTADAGQSSDDIAAMQKEIDERIKAMKLSLDEVNNK